jgi:hypothetical protein
MFTECSLNVPFMFPECSLEHDNLGAEAIERRRTEALETGGLNAEVAERERFVKHLVLGFRVSGF